MGEWALKNLERGGFEGRVHAVNPNRKEVRGIPCRASIAELPDVPELAIFAVGDARVEAALAEAIAAGIPAAVIMSALVLDDDAEPKLRERVAATVREAGMLVCGGNGMGFYNVRDRVWACGFDSTDHVPPGRVALISHSGAGMSGLIDSEERLRINFAVSTGNELAVTMDEYLDFVLELPETRAVGLFVETARDPAGLRAAFAKAKERRIPIVAVKVGRSEAAARLTESHSGALAGDDAAWTALFERYGVQRVCDLDELATALILFSELPPVGEGGLVALHDSGGERQLLIDLAGDAGVPLTTLDAATMRELERVLDPELPAVNPLDGWSRGGADASERMAECLAILMQDPGAALGFVAHDRAPGGTVYASYLGYLQQAHAATGKPVLLAAARQGTGHDTAVVASTRKGLPVLDGLPATLRGVRALFDYRDFLARPDEEVAPPDTALVARWHERLADGDRLSEHDALEMLAEFGVPAVQSAEAADAPSVLEAAAKVGFPLVLKTANPGIAHKTDADGVVLDIGGENELLVEYTGMSARLGRKVTVAALADDGVEMILGAKRDAQFGAVVVLGFGGVHAEILEDVSFALPPFGPAHARRCLDRLRLRPLLDGARGLPPADVDAFCEAASRFSAMVYALADYVTEFDVNPVIVHERGCTAVDALIVS